MRTSLVVIGVATAALLAGCSGERSGADQSAAQSSDRSSTQPSGRAGDSVALPPEPEPEAEGPCPYLDTEFVSQANGQRVAEVKTSADEPHPTCFFYRPDGDLQLTVRVYVGEPGTAVGLVDAAAPVDTSNPTSQPTGWKGGYESTDDGAVYAVAKGGNAVIVTTNQRQSVKARSVATETITALGL